MWKFRGLLEHFRVGEFQPRGNYGRSDSLPGGDGSTVARQLSIMADGSVTALIP